MPLPTQLVTIPLAQGINQSIDPKIAPAGVLTNLENGRVLKTGEVSKRNGFTALTKNTMADGDTAASITIGTDDAAVIDAGYRLFGSKDILFLGASHTPTASGSHSNYKCQKDFILAYSSANTRWDVSGGFDSPFVSMKSGFCFDADGSRIDPSVAYANGKLMYAYILDAATNVAYRVEVNADNHYVIETTRTNSKDTVSVVGVGNNFYTFMGTTTNLEIYLNHATAAAYTYTITNSMWDAAAFDSTDFVVAYRDGSGDIVVRKPISGQSTTRTPTAAASDALAVVYANTGTNNTASGAVIVVYQASNSIRAMWFAGSNLAFQADWLVMNLNTVYSIASLNVRRFAISPGFIGLGPESADNNRFAIYVDMFADVLSQFTSPEQTVVLQLMATLGSTTVAADSTYIPYHSLASRCFVQNGKAYVFTHFASSTQPSFFLHSNRGFSQISSTPLMKMLDGSAVGRSFNVANSAVAQTSSGVFIVPLISIGLTGEDDNFLVGAELDFNRISPNATAYDEAGRVFNGGAYLGYNESRFFAENGFLLFPESLTHTGTTPDAGGSIAAGTYRYVATYEYINSYGEVERSAPSNEVTVVVAATANAVGFRVLQSVVSQFNKAGSIRIQLYRTTAGGSIFYRLESYSTNGEIITDSNNSDATIQNNAQLYTTGGVSAENIAPGSACICRFNARRLFVVPYDERGVIWVSKQKTPGLGYEFSDLLKYDPGVGDINALEFMDGKCFIFTSSSIYYFSGSGPLDNGSGGFSDPIKIPSAVGAIECSATIASRDGIFFQTTDGIHLLTRDHTIVPIGKSIRDRTERITSITHLEEESEIFFSFNSTPNSAVFNTDHNLWSYYTPMQAVSSCVVDGTFYWVNSAGQVYQQDTGFVDNASDIVLKLTTAWLNLNGINGFERIRWFSLLGEFKTNHVLSVKVYYDHNDTLAQTITINTSTALSVSDQVYRFRARLNRQKCSAIRFEISDASGASTKENYSISAIVLGVAAKSGITRLRTGKTI